MRILLITWNYPPKIGGMEMMLYQLVQHLPSRFEVDVIAPGKESISSLEERAHIIRASDASLGGFYMSAFRNGWQTLNRHEYDLLVAGSALVTPIVFLLGKLFAKKTVAHVYGLDLIYPRALYQLMVKRFLQHFHLVLAISEASRREAIARGVDSTRIKILTPGVSLDEFDCQPDVRVPKRRHKLNGKKIILYAGRLAERKGVLEFVSHSLPDIVSQFPDSVLVIAGGNADQSLSHGGDMESRILEEARRQNLDGNVRLLGRIGRHELISLFHACQLLILPAIPVPGDMEGFGIVLLEANAAGKPVVSTRLGGITDAVAEGKSGILVEPGSWPDFTGAVVRLLSSKETAQELGTFGRDRVRNQFDWPIIGQHYADLLEKSATV